MTRKFIVRLTDEERTLLTGMVSKGKAAAYKIKHANILLKADQSGPAWPDAAIGAAFGCSLRTAVYIRQRFVEQGFDAALSRKPQSRPSRMPTLDGEKEARLIAISCGKPPAGRSAWTLRLLADQLVALDIVDSISYETVRVALKKKRTQAASAEMLGHSAGAKCRFCRAHGRRTGSVPASI